MRSNLYSLNKLFTDRLFRIPDYQRGYAWQEKHISDFWIDLINLKDDRYHYAGVITLEEVGSTIYKNWQDDYWIIKSKRYEPYFVVDGQQRLTTSIVLLQTILETIPSGEKLNFTDQETITRRYIFESKDNGVSRSYMFGYSNDDHSYEFLKSKIFCEPRDQLLSNLETIYTSNLTYAKIFFSEKLKNLPFHEIEKIFERLTQQFLFNVYSINDDMDVCMAFETMNNRGRPLSQLELLKNRLIYLSTKIDCEEYEKDKLRRCVNDSWKSIYHNLGKSKNSPLDDDDFLQTHFCTYFPNEYEEKRSDNLSIYSEKLISRYGECLLSKIFIESRINSTKNPQDITIEYLYAFAKNIGRSSESWWNMHNPSTPYFGDHEAICLQRLLRIGIGDFAAIILLFMQKETDCNKRIALFEALELLNFYRSLRSRIYYYSPIQSHRAAGEYIPSFPDLVAKYSRGEIPSNSIISTIESEVKRVKYNSAWIREVRSGFKSNGFYSWQGIRYFLYEYEQHLKEQAKVTSQKLNWADLEPSNDFYTVEHIYPQNARKQYWVEHFQGFNSQQRESLRNSLGNLLPLPRRKNSILSNSPFPEKVDNGNNCGYRFGSFSEIEVPKNQHWTPEKILKRGVNLISFMEKRWKISLGSHDDIVEMLGLSFLQNQSNLKIE